MASLNPGHKYDIRLHLPTKVIGITVSVDKSSSVTARKTACLRIPKK